MAKKYEKFKYYSIGQSTLYNLVLRALRICDYAVMEKDDSARLVEGKIKSSLKSWGERYKVSIMENDDFSKVYFQSKCVMPIQVIDFGKNRDNIKSFYRTLDELVDFYKETCKGEDGKK